MIRSMEGRLFQLPCNDVALDLMAEALWIFCLFVSTFTLLYMVALESSPFNKIMFNVESEYRAIKGSDLRCNVQLLVVSQSFRKASTKVMHFNCEAGQQTMHKSIPTPSTSTIVSRHSISKEYSTSETCLGN